MGTVAALLQLLGIALTLFGVASIRSLLGQAATALADTAERSRRGLATRAASTREAASQRWARRNDAKGTFRRKVGLQGTTSLSTTGHVVPGPLDRASVEALIAESDRRLREDIRAIDSGSRWIVGGLGLQFVGTVLALVC